MVYFSYPSVKEQISTSILSFQCQSTVIFSVFLNIFHLTCVVKINLGCHIQQCLVSHLVWYSSTFFTQVQWLMSQEFQGSKPGFLYVKDMHNNINFS